MMMQALMMLAMLPSQEAPRGGRIEWRHDLEGALEESRRQIRPAMLYFTSDT